MPREDRTEKATPKHRKRAREKGEVARSPDLSGAAVLIGGLVAIGAMGSRIEQATASGWQASLWRPSSCIERPRQKSA